MRRGGGGRVSMYSVVWCGILMAVFCVCACVCACVCMCVHMCVCVCVVPYCSLMVASNNTLCVRGWESTEENDLCTLREWILIIHVSSNVTGY